jgi:hypothetical protein
MAKKLELEMPIDSCRLVRIEQEYLKTQTRKTIRFLPSGLHMVFFRFCLLFSRSPGLQKHPKNGEYAIVTESSTAKQKIEEP